MCVKCPEHFTQKTEIVLFHEVRIIVLVKKVELKSILNLNLTVRVFSLVLDEC